MTITEKVAYLKGLADGFELDQNKPETKLFNAMLEVLEDLALTVCDLEDELALASEQLDAVDEDLEDLEEFVYSDYDDDCDCCSGDDFDDYGDDENLYEVECPACHEEIFLDESILEEGTINCPNCDELLEFEIDCDCCEQGDDE